LTAHFGPNQVFIDIDQIEPGEDFVEAINAKVGACEVAIVSIGPDWLNATDASGKRRLDDTEDFVRMEIIAALQRKIRVIPVLMGGARMPTKQDLPEELAPLSRRNAIELSETRFHSDVDRLIEAIEKPRTIAQAEKTNATQVSAPPAGPSVSGGKAVSAKVLMVIGAMLVLGCLIWFFTQRRAETASGRSHPATALTISPIPAANETSLSASPDNIASRTADTSPGPNPNEEDWMPDIRKLAENGSAEAQFEMGTFYELGYTSIPADLRKAMEWYRKAAAQGHGLAREGLEDLSHEGATLSPNETLKLTTRRTSRQQLSSSAVLRAMDAKARDTIRKMNE
jgi:hypothetical protein